MKKSVLFISFLLFSLAGQTQEIAQGVYWVYFTDKEGLAYQIDQPEDFLAARSIERRAWQGLGIDQRDLPVNPAYVKNIRDMGIEIRHISRWLNGVAMVQINESTFVQVLELAFCDTLPWLPQTQDIYYPVKKSSARFEEPLHPPPAWDYGSATTQVEMLRTNFLHSQGYTGKGVWLGVMDGGFSRVDSLPAFEQLLSEDRILETRNYVDAVHPFRSSSTHGMRVLSAMASEWDGQLVGTAPHASYLLCVTEDSDQETRIEECAWIEALEYADSLGIDVINTSLGYSEFDQGIYDYTYRDMDGNSALISKAASLAASRGIILVNSAGNSGNDAWYYITAPADARDILAVGAVDSTGMIVRFSSRGPTFDNRIKPDVSAQGLLTALQGSNGTANRGNGTSYASPLVAGSVASLWQAYPDIPAAELMRWVRGNSDRSQDPGISYGFGIPDFLQSYYAITSIPEGLQMGELEVWPNPASDFIQIRIPETGMEKRELRFYDLQGRVAWSTQVELPARIQLPQQLPPSFYILEIRTSGTLYRSRLILH